MYNRILVPLDQSGRSEKILECASDLAARYKSEIMLLHVLQPIPVAPNMPDYVPHPPLVYEFDNENNASQYLERVQKNLHDREIKARYIVERGDVVSTILRIAQKTESDLIAMASHGRTGLQRVFYGSVAAGVLAQIDRPLLLIRALDQAA